MFYYLIDMEYIWGTNDESIAPKGAIKITNEQYEEYIYKTNNGYDANFIVKGESVTITYTLQANWENIKKEYELEALRNKRKPLLEAFDKYKSNVNYGVETEDKATREIILVWYNNLLNLVETAFNDNYIPEQIKYYLS